MPNAAFSHDSKRGDRANDHFLELPEIPVEVELVAIEINDGISDELSWAVKGHVAAAFHIEEFDAARCQEFGSGKQRRGIARGAAERDDRGMLDEHEQVLLKGAVEARACGGALEGEHVGKGAGAEVGDVEVALGGHD